MKNSAFRHYSLNQAKRMQLTVNRFGGVDYSTQKFLVADGKAIDIKNYIYKDGVVQKRHGYEHLFNVNDYSYYPADFENPTANPTGQPHNNHTEENDKRFNGIWRFKAEDGQYHTVAHIGKLLYEIKKENFIGGQLTAVPIIVKTNSYDYDTVYEFENYKSSAFVGGNKLWFLGGNRYMCLRFVSTGTDTRTLLFSVEDSDHTPIPVTTISITYKNSTVNNRMPLDNINLLTKWRKNKFISGTTKNEDEKTKTTFFEYTLDAPLIVESNKDMADIRMTIEEQGVIN